MHRTIRFLAACGLSMITAIAATYGAHSQTPEAATGGWIADGEPGSFAFEFSRRLYHESLPAARDYAEGQISIAGQTAEFAYGTTLFLGAVEGLAADLSRHGLRRDPILGIPVLRLWIPPSDAREVMTYERFRRILQSFVDRLANAEAVLSKVDDASVVLPIRPAGPRLDLNGDGIYDSHERLLPILAQMIDPGGMPDEDAWREIELNIDDFVRRLAEGDPGAIAYRDEIAPAFGFDRADAAWLAGYTHLLSAMMEFVLAHDFEDSFNASFHVFFPDGDFPNPKMKEIYGETPVVTPFGTDTAFIAYGLDIASFAIHSPWAVAEPEKMAAVRTHLKAMVVQSRRSWDFAAAEADNRKVDEPPPGVYAEWIPYPNQRQTEGFPSVTPNVLRGWLQFLDAFEGMLDGRLLIPHWRFDEGINLRRMFEEPRPLSPLLLIQGSDALPYLEKGRLADAAYLFPIIDLIGGDFFAYAVWFN